MSHPATPGSDEPATISAHLVRDPARAGRSHPASTCRAPLHPPLGRRGSGLRLRGPFRAGALAAAAALVAATAGCGALKSLMGAGTVELENAEIQEMKLDLRKPQKTICPREPVQVAVMLRAKLDGEAEARWYETWQGKSDADQSGKLDFQDFVLQSDFGKFNDGGWFSPTPDLLATVDKELTIKAATRVSPAPHTASGSYKPDYDCIASGGARGIRGQQGTPGRHGNVGVAAGQGQAGGDGNLGTAGGRGTDGSPGPDLRAFVTYVATPFYPKLVAVRIEGSVQDFLLFPPGKPFTLKAVGGNGGPGGAGGDGGPGGTGGYGDPTPGDGGRGADGSKGGDGGNGGPGGTIELVYDERFPDLAQAVKLDASGGVAGGGGAFGRGGRGGTGGLQPKDTTAQGGGQGERGADGANGAPGSPGKAGPAGTASARAGEIGPLFRGIRGVTPL